MITTEAIHLLLGNRRLQGIEQGKTRQSQLETEHKILLAMDGQRARTCDIAKKLGRDNSHINRIMREMVERRVLVRQVKVERTGRNLKRTFFYSEANRVH